MPPEPNEIDRAISNTDALIKDGTGAPNELARHLLTEVRNEYDRLGSAGYRRYENMIQTKYADNPEVSAMLSSDFQLVNAETGAHQKVMGPPKK